LHIRIEITHRLFVQVDCATGFQRSVTSLETRISLRIRRNGNKRLQTMKSQGAGGSFRRREWENEIKGDVPDLRKVQGTTLEPLLTKKLKHKLMLVFETRVRRTIVPVRRIWATNFDTVFEHHDALGAWCYACGLRQPAKSESPMARGGSWGLASRGSGRPEHRGLNRLKTTIG
jgi:CYTH domain